MLETLAQKLNFKPVIKICDGNFNYSPMNSSDMNGVTGAVYHRLVDFGLAFSVTLSFSGKVRRPFSFQATCFTWCLPVGYRKEPLFQHVVGEFDGLVWLGILASYVTAVSFLHMTGEKGEYLLSRLLLSP